MNETVTNTTSSVRHGKDLSLDSPLLNLILAASLLTKITKPKASAPSPSYKRGPPLPYKFSEDYYGGLPWYPHDSSHFYKLQTSLDSQQTNFPIKQHIIHIHQRPLKGRPATSTILEVAKPEAILTTTQSSTSTVAISEIPVQTTKPEEGTTISDGVTEMSPKLDKTNSEELQNADDEVVASPSNQLTQELKDFLTDFFTKNNIIPASQNVDKSAESPLDLEEPQKSEKMETADEMNLDNISQEIAENISEVTSEQLVENMSETMVDKMAEDLPKNATENEVKHMSEKVIQNLPASILENIPPEMLEQISEKISQQITEKLSEKFSKDVSNHMLEKLAQLIPDRDNEKEIRETSENNSDNEENSDENKIPESSVENFPVFSEEKEEHGYEQELPYVDATQVTFLNNEPEETDSMMMDASTIDLLPSETQKAQNSQKSAKKSKKNSEDDEYVFSGTGEDDDDEDDEDDVLNDSETEVEHNLPTRVSPKFAHKFRATTQLPQNRKASKGKISSLESQERINSKRPSPNKRRTTPISLIYDEYEEAAPNEATSMGKRKVQYYNSGNAKKTQQRKPTPSSQEYDFDNEEQPQRQVQGQMKKNKKGAPRRRTTTTTPTYDDYYNDPVEESEEDQANQEYEEEAAAAATTLKPRPTRRPTRRPDSRQVTTTTTEGTTITDTGPTDTNTETPTTIAMSTNATVTPTPATIVTSGEYPYYGNNNYQNVSITYGPPVQQYPGYGPSNGNEQVSFTYAPPSSSGGGGAGFTGLSGSGGTGSGVAAAGVAPMLDSWYNQYARNSMYKRIHDLLTPNNFYNQYDVNYNDASV